VNFKNFLAVIKPAFRRKHIFLTLNGFLLASLLYFYMEDSYEKQVFQALTNHVNVASAHTQNKDTLILHSLHLTHVLGERRIDIFTKENISTLKSFIHPVTYDLQTTQGACGSYSYILSRLLKEQNIESRIAQMTVKGTPAGHMVVEAKTSHGWAVIDPTYDVFFTKADGTLADFKEVSGNWEHYKKQVPANYDQHYAYAGVRYTNWDKIPVVMPVLKQLMYVAIGKERTNSFSMRTLFLRKYNVLFNVTLTVYLLLIFITLRKYSRRLFKNRIPQMTIVSRPTSVSRSAV
jgi:hypothetical protein